MTPADRPGQRHRTRARIWLGVGLGVFTLVVIGLFLLRPKDDPYTAGAEVGRSDEITSGLARSLPPDAPAITFTEAADAAGLRFRHFHGPRSTQLPEDMGSGAAWGDYDDDGDPDLYLVNFSGPVAEDGTCPSSPARSTLYRNDGDGRFTDVTDAAGAGVGGCGMGAAWGDYDGDGRLDLVITRFGTNVLLRNAGDGSFADVSAESGVGNEDGFWAGASWGDHDGDGDVDLYVTGYVRYRHDPLVAGRTSFQYGAVLPFTLNPSSYPPDRNLLLVNEGGRFRDAAAAAGVDNTLGRSLSASWCDFDNDRRPDLYVANDISDNAMYWNRGDGSFVDVSHSAWVADYRGAMGLAAGDWDADGDLDIFVTHWIAQENALYENLLDRMPPTDAEPMHFIDQADMFGLGQIALDYIGWGTGFADFDNDGRLDLFVANGSTFPVEKDPTLLVPMRNLLFWNGGRDRGFFEIGTVAGAPFAVENVARGSAHADYDGDGDLDIVVAVNGGEARLLRNEGGHTAGRIRVIVRGPRAPVEAPGPARTSTFAVGARVAVEVGGTTRMQEIGCGSSYLSQDPPGEAHFGTGRADRIDVLHVTWPDGRVDTWRDLPARATVRLVEGEEPVVTPDAPGAP